MTPESLKAALVVVEQRLTVALDTLSSGLAAALGPFLPPGGQLVLDPVTERTESDDGVSVTGTGTAEPFTGLTVTAAFAVVAGEVTLHLAAAGGSTWSFGTSLPRLRGTLLNLLRFSAPVLSFDWTGGDPAAAHLAFAGELTTATGIALPDLVLPPAGSALTGSVTVQPAPDVDPSFGTDRWPDVVVEGPTRQVDLGPLHVTGIHYRTTADPRPTAALGEPPYDPGLAVAGTLPVNLDAVARSIAISAELIGPADAALFAADFSDVGELRLDDIATFLGQALAVPFPFEVPGTVRLARVELLYTPGATNPVARLAATVHTGAQWAITDRLTIAGIDITFTVEPTGPSVAATGLIDIAGVASLEINADSQSRMIGARLRAGDPPLPVSTVYTALTGRDATDLPNLAVQRYESTVTLPATDAPLAVSSLLQLDGTWSITDGVVLSEISFDVSHSSARTSFEAAATFGLDNINVSVRAGYDSTDGWRFAGQTGPGQQIPIGKLVDSLSDQFARIHLPAPLAGLTVSNLRATFGTKSTDVTFGAEATFPVGADQSADILVSITFKKGTDGYEGTFGGQLTIGELAFDLRFAASSTDTLFVATYRGTGAARTIGVSQLVATVSSDVAALVPTDLTIELNDAILAVNRTTAGTTVLVGLDLGARLDLSGLPLVGQLLPDDQTASIEDLRLLVATGALDRAGVAAINASLPDAVAKLPVPSAPGTPDVAVPRGLTVSARLNLGGTPQTLALPVAAGTGSGTGGNQPATPAAPVAVTSSDSAKWFTLQKTLGPLYLARIGVRYQDAVLWVLLDAALSALGLTIALDGLALGSPVDHFDPRFDLRGLGIDYRNPAIEIGAAFLRTTVTDDQGRKYDEYDGAAVLKAKALTLSAIGSYAYLDGHPSLFIYAVLDYPIGGPSFFFVTGLAAGFGYNRALIVPPVEGVAQFPLVAEATKGATPPASTDNPAQRVAAELAALRSAVPPSIGQNFLAVGIRFTSFQILDSFALLTVAFGQRFEVNLLGLSTMVVPPRIPGDAAVPPLAELQLALKASFVPDDGFLSVTAQLTPASYLLSRDCHLTGGFAFSCWFPGTGAPVPHAGDFVLTLGGYHPNFTVPDHYPRVPRLGLNWKVSDQLAVKGESYFALTPSMLMCGIVLDATWTSGDLRAWFHAGADFLVAWKPYHYDAHAYASLQVSYRFEFFGTREIRLDASADLHLWGPAFSGTARVSLSVIEFDIAFGDAAPKPPPAIEWTEFKASFLPASACGVVLRDGLIRKVSGAASNDLGVVNPKQFVLVTDSVIPATSAVAGAPIDLSDLALSQVGVAPMAVPAGALTASHTIEISRNGQRAEQHFTFTPVIKRLPAALWGDKLTPALGDADFVERALAGFEIRPGADAEPTAGTTVAKDDWQYVDAVVTPTYHWESGTPGPLGGEPAQAQAIRDTIAAGSTVAARDRLLAALGITAPVDVDASVADAFLTVQGAMR
ncbi:DUF6603 domain-containing protein [Rugosimonospora africana]|uniref:DUF6603 domain-containing protein n=1 Tax=Rugosimonospora africana TaxID=556532 RepID=A0A8J3QT22_9ACTN|nr:DUF6603 domain-containing protein [Rugosimonospora africana]GIH15128.1 hypothetical protein Raf01_33000 [Rugosimonospora africana]